MRNDDQLTRLPRVRYSGCVTEKEVTEFDSSICMRRTSALRRLFFVRSTLVCSLRAAVVGSLRAAGFRMRRSVNPAICRPPRLTAGSGLTTAYGGSHAW